MRLNRVIMLQVTWALVFASAVLRADPGDVDGAHDYVGFPRLPGFVISDYDEDDPAGFDFPTARSVKLDSNHIETVHVKGHRYAIRYELATGQAATPLYDTQKYYEKLATDEGFTLEKTGATGNVTETFYKETDKGSIWIYLEPAVTVNVVTVVESAEMAPPPPLQIADTSTKDSDSDDMSSNSDADMPAIPATLPDSPPPALPTEQSDDVLYTQLNSDGRVIVPFVFKPNKDALDDSSQELVDRVAAMMKAHPDLLLRIEGHTDNSGDADHNMRLSAQRAMAIEAKLIDDHIDKKRLDAVGVGGLQPLADNDTAEGRERNRRIELVTWQKVPAFHAHSKVPEDTEDTSAAPIEINNDPSFHAAAPNGNNYYPSASTSNTPPKNAF